MIKVIFALAVALTVQGCGTTMVVLKDTKTGAMAQCQADPWLNWNPYAATEACARGYENAGYTRTGAY